LAAVFDDLEQLASLRHVAQIVFLIEQFARQLVFRRFQSPNRETPQTRNGRIGSENFVV
jgi:hypothetical protein